MLMRRTFAVAVAATLAAGLAPAAAAAQATTGGDRYKRVAYFIQWGIYG
ncbi:hypothetical protein [Microbispora catharanthi]|nr:hypothetical protein [Microbispora catharanthi]